MSPRTRLATVFAATVATIGGVIYLSNYESSADQTRKPQTTSLMVQNSQDICTAHDANYAQRLNAVLSDVKTQDLETIQNAGVVIVLDQRLSEQITGTWDRTIQGIFYNNAGQKIVTLWDDGRPPSESSTWSQDTYDYGAKMLTDLAEEIRDGNMPADVEMLIGARFSTGKTSYSDWRDKESFSDELSKNPSLQKPPAPKMK